MGRRKPSGQKGGRVNLRGVLFKEFCDIYNDVLPFEGYTEEICSDWGSSFTPVEQVGIASGAFDRTVEPCGLFHHT